MDGEGFDEGYGGGSGDAGGDTGTIEREPSRGDTGADRRAPRDDTLSTIRKAVDNQKRAKGIATSPDIDDDERDENDRLVTDRLRLAGLVGVQQAIGLRDIEDRVLFQERNFARVVVIGLLRFQCRNELDLRAMLAFATRGKRPHSLARPCSRPHQYRSIRPESGRLQQNPGEFTHDERRRAVSKFGEDLVEAFEEMAAYLRGEVGADCHEPPSDILTSDHIRAVAEAVRFGPDVSNQRGAQEVTGVAKEVALHPPTPPAYPGQDQSD